MADLKTDVLNIVPGVMSLAVLKNASKVLKNPKPQKLTKVAADSIVGIALTNAVSRTI